MEVRKYELYLKEEKVWETKEEYRMCSSEEVSKFGREELKMDKWDREKFVVLALNAKLEVIGYQISSIGELSSALVHPRELAKFLILSNAAATIMMHNHPSGDPTSSGEDINTTKQLNEVMKMLGIFFADHIVIARNGFVSIKEEVDFE